MPAPVCSLAGPLLAGRAADGQLIAEQLDQSRSGDELACFRRSVERASIAGTGLRAAEVLEDAWPAVDVLAGCTHPWIRERQQAERALQVVVRRAEVLERHPDTCAGFAASARGLIISAQTQEVILQPALWLMLPEWYRVTTRSQRLSSHAR